MSDSKILSILDQMDLPSIDSPMQQLVMSNLTKRWMLTDLSRLYNMRLDTNHDYSTALRWVYEGGDGVWTFGSIRHFFFSHNVTHNPIYGTWLDAEGYMEVLWFKAKDLRLDLFDSDFIRFNVEYEAQVKVHYDGVTIDSKTQRDYGDACNLFPCRISFGVPIKLLKCWLQGKFQNPGDGLRLVSSENSKMSYKYYVNEEYVTLRYPSVFARWICKTGHEVLDQLNEEGFLTDELLEFLKGTIKPYFPPSPAAIANKSIALQYALRISDKDREQLRKIAEFGDFLSISKWGKYFGLSKSGADSLIKRFKAQGWVSVDKGVNGTRIALTDKGKSVLKRVL